MKPAIRILILLPLILCFGFSLSAQNDGYQKADQGYGSPRNNNSRQYATPADQTNPAQDDGDEDDPLKGGNFSIGAGFGYVNTISDVEIDNGATTQKGGNSGYQLHLTPSIGYFIARNFVFGLGMDYMASASEDNSDNNTSNGTPRTEDTKLLFGPFARIFFPFAGDQALFLGGVYAYGKSKTELSNGTENQTVNTTLMTFGFGPGYSIFSHGKVALECQAKYNYGISNNRLRVDTGNQRTRTETTAWDFVVGLHFYFSRD